MNQKTERASPGPAVLSTAVRRIVESPAGSTYAVFVAGFMVLIAGLLVFVVNALAFSLAAAGFALAAYTLVAVVILGSLASRLWLNSPAPASVDPEFRPDPETFRLYIAQLKAARVVNEDGDPSLLRDLDSAIRDLEAVGSHAALPGTRRDATIRSAVERAERARTELARAEPTRSTQSRSTRAR